MGLDSPVAIAGFRLLTLVLILWGALQDLNTVFAFADLTMALLALVNLIALLLLLKVGLRLMRDYERQRAAGIVSPSFDPSMFPDLNIDPQAWPIPQGQTAESEVSGTASVKPQPS
jgi:AGCS family alanine or glycine:cation symporter